MFSLNDPALTAVLESLFIFREAHGPEKLKDLLAQELGREAIAARLKASQRNEAGEALHPVPSSLTEDDEVALFSVLEFYGKEANWERQGSKPSAMMRDRGQRAREILDRLADSGGSE